MQADKETLQRIGELYLNLKLQEQESERLRLKYAEARQLLEEQSKQQTEQ